MVQISKGNECEVSVSERRNRGRILQELGGVDGGPKPSERHDHHSKAIRSSSESEKSSSIDGEMKKSRTGENRKKTAEVEVQTDEFTKCQSEDDVKNRDDKSRIMS